MHLGILENSIREKQFLLFRRDAFASTTIIHSRYLLKESN